MPEISAAGTINDLGGNLCSDGSGGLQAGHIMLDSNGLQDNGGPTLTIGLSPQSPAINGAADCYGLSIDQRGMPRPVGSACDIGALEVQRNETFGSSIPTLSQWGMFFMSLMLGAAALWMIRSRRIPCE